MAQKSDLPQIIVQLRSGLSLFPTTGLDAELLNAYRYGDIFGLDPEPKRSPPLHRTYWLALSRVLESTGLSDDYPTKEKLHAALLWGLNFVHVELDDHRRPRLARDSTAFHNMRTDAEFKPYFDLAMATLARMTGLDPLDFLQ